MNKIKYITTFLIISYSLCLSSQSIVETELTTNAVLIEKWKQLSERGNLKLGSITDTISFGPKGILEDFSYDSPYPDTSVWLDNYVYINRDFPRAPITLGVATFDGLDATGYPYNFQASSGSSGLADFLTSKPIDLAYNPIDSIYFSFYYQPQGLGNAPEIADSLVLQFKEPGNSASWKNVWARTGQQLSANDSSWKLVMVPITNVNYLKKGFQFRFKNYATLSGNVDHWHIDYVYINKSRKHYEKQFDDIAYVYNIPSLLKNYSKIPFNHYNSGLLIDSIPNWVRNNDVGGDKQVSYGNVIKNETNSIIIDSYTSANSFNVRPFDSTFLYTGCDFPLGCRRYDSIDASKFPSTLSAKTKISVTQYIYKSGGGLDIMSSKNDTLVLNQNFDNYYAYDDGTAEASVALSPLNSLMAQKFVITTADTLQAIDIYWNPVLINATLYTFNLKVWNDNGGIPGTAIFTDTTMYPVYNATGYNRFTRHYLNKGKPYLTPGTYYFGLKQNAVGLNLTIGLDKNINTQYKVFHNTNGTWQNSPFAGSLMLHPVFGATSEFVGIENNSSKKNQIVIFPNPAKDQLFINNIPQNTNEYVTISIIDLFGRIVKEIIEDGSIESVDISDISNGIYIIRITSREMNYTNKFIISK